MADSGQDSSQDSRWMTYAEAAAALRVNPESVARQARRNGWAKRKGNDNKPRVAVPVKLLPIPVGQDAGMDTGLDSRDSGMDSNPDTAGLVMALAFHAQAATERAERAEAAHLAATERAAAAEAALAEVREALAREIRQAEGGEEARKAAETQRDAAQAARDATAAELAGWAAGGPLARAWRAFWRGRL